MYVYTYVCMYNSKSLVNLEVNPLAMIKLKVDSLEVIKFLVFFFLILFSIFFDKTLRFYHEIICIGVIGLPFLKHHE